MNWYSTKVRELRKAAEVASSPPSALETSSHSGIGFHPLFKGKILWGLSFIKCEETELG